MTDRDEIAKVLAVQGWCCSPDDHMQPDMPWEEPGDCSECDALRLATADALLASPAFADLIREAKREGWERRDKPWTHGDKQVPIVPPELRDDSGTHEVECAGWEDCHCFGYLNPYDKENG